MCVYLSRLVSSGPLDVHGQRASTPAVFERRVGGASKQGSEWGEGQARPPRLLWIYHHAQLELLYFYYVPCSGLAS